jgi:alanyl-tRNA synthetase
MERIYYHDAYVRQFRARVVEPVEGGVVLDQTAFYPTSGGQPHDLGTLNGVPVVNVEEDAAGRIVHHLAAPLTTGGEVDGRLDWPRRWDHMQQHTGQHLLSAVFVRDAQMPTVSFHLGAGVSTIDLEGPAPSPATLAAVEAAANAEIAANRAVTISFAEAEAAAGLRKASEREGTLRLIDIEGLDRSACGGTHVRRTGEIQCLLLRKVEKVRHTWRVEFVCGMRALRRARADFEQLSAAAKVYSSSLDDVAQMAAHQQEKAQEADKARRKLASEWAALQGQAWYLDTPRDEWGRRIRVDTSWHDETRALAQAFTAGPRAAYLVVGEAVLLAVAKDSGLNAGAILKEVLAATGGRGGGTPLLAQGSVPASEAPRAQAMLLERIREPWPN